MTTTHSEESQSAELFDSGEYRVPFPDADGKQVTDLIVRLGGSIELSRNDPDHARFVEALTLGRFVTLEVTASVVSKAQMYRVDKEGVETVPHVVGLKIEAIETT
jgi:hypothetical protein